MSGFRQDTFICNYQFLEDLLSNIQLGNSSQADLLRLALISKDTEIGLRNELTQVKMEYAKFREEIYKSHTWRIGRFFLGLIGRKHKHDFPRKK